MGWNKKALAVVAEERIPRTVNSDSAGPRTRRATGSTAPSMKTSGAVSNVVQPTSCSMRISNFWAQDQETTGIRQSMFQEKMTFGSGIVRSPDQLGQ